MRKLVILLAALVSGLCGAQDLREGTAGQFIQIGPFLNATTGAAEQALTITAAEVFLTKNDGTTAAKNEGTACSHEAVGRYTCAINALDTDQPGELCATVEDSGALARGKCYSVLKQQYYDVKYDPAIPVLTGAGLGVLEDTTVSVVNGTTSWILATGPTNNMNGAVVVVRNAAGTAYFPTRMASYTGASKTLIVEDNPTFTVQIGDRVIILAPGLVSPADLVNQQEGVEAGLAAYDAAVQDKLLGYFQLMTRNDVGINTDRAVELSELNNDEGSGAGNYTNTLWSMQAPLTSSRIATNAWDAAFAVFMNKLIDGLTMECIIAVGASFNGLGRTTWDEPTGVAVYRTNDNTAARSTIVVNANQRVSVTENCPDAY